jgi:single-stranded-DNA-specific exonuclease
MKYRWSIAPPQPVLTAALTRQLGLSPLLAQCLLNRGLSDPDPLRGFLAPRLKDLADPFAIPNMTAAVDRLFAAREAQELVVLFGDYDVDGVTSTTLLEEVLRRLGWQVKCYLPHRLEEGYGLSEVGVANCLERFPAQVLFAVDCGSTAVATVDWLRDRKIDTIVLDHHQVSSPLPAACALVNPQAAGSAGPFVELCSVGLAFKLAHALVKRGRAQNLPGAADFDLRPLLDLVALGTVADLVPLRGENRILVSAGLARLNSTQRPGLLALRKVSGTTGVIGSQEVGFQLAPRLNAAGRLETAEEALCLLQAPTLEEAEPLAQRLDLRNRERRRIEQNMVAQVIGAVRSHFDPATDHVIVEGQLLWHIGVVGIVASRVRQEFYRPTLIIGGEGDEWRGSGRSIEGFDLAAALRECDDLLLRHGGHAMAAGITVRPDQIDALRSRLNDLARRALKPDQLRPTLLADAEVELGELTLGRLRELALLDPCGVGNPRVQLVVRNATHARPLQRMGADKKHARLWVSDGRHVLEAVLWGVGDGPLPVGRFDLACTVHLHEFNGTQSVRLQVIDWRNAVDS